MPYALGGARLEANQLVRFAFSDESGTNPWDRYFVVAGPLVDGDRELIPVENRLEELVRKYIPLKDQPGFVFHAADIWNNNDYFEDRKTWPRELCWEILWDLSMIPMQFGLPISVGITERSRITERLGEAAPDLDKRAKPQAHDVLSHALAFLSFTLRVEQEMKEEWPGESCKLVAERRDKVEDTVREVHQLLKRPDSLRNFSLPTEHLPLTRIRGGVNFETKDENPLLQVADTCAFVIRGVANGNLELAPFYHLLWPLLMNEPKMLMPWPLLEWPMGPLIPLWREKDEERQSELGRFRRFLRGERRPSRDASKRNVE